MARSDEDEGKLPASGGSRRRRGRRSGSDGPPGKEVRPRNKKKAPEKAPKQGSVTKDVQRGKWSRFLSEVIAELRKVTWPNRAQLAQGTAVVLVVVAIVTAYLYVLDTIFGRMIDVLF